MTISSPLPRRTLMNLTAAALTGVGVTALGAAPAMAAATGYTTAELSLRAGTNTGTRILTRIPAGRAIRIECQTPGQSISGTYNTHFWAKTSYNGHTGWVSRAYVRVPDARGLGSCGASAPSTPPPPVGNNRKIVLDRAATWVNRGVPYSMSAYTYGPQGGRWRTDCSGFIAMAFNLGDKSYSTINLPERFYPISKNQLVPGDIVGNLGPGTGGANGHVAIFNGWVDGSKTRFYTIEMTPPRAQRRVATWGSSFWTRNAYRLRGW